MKYLTKKWFESNEQSIVVEYLKKRIDDESASEVQFEKLYNTDLQLFLEYERGNCKPLSAEGFSEFETWLNTQKISEKQKKLWVKVYWKFVKEGTHKEFNEEAVREKYHNLFEERLRIIKDMPQYILQEISDIRVFCLGYATEKVWRMVERYSKEKECEYMENVEIVNIENAKVQKALDSSVDFEKYSREELLGIDNENGNIIMMFLEVLPLVIENGKIIQQEADIDKLMKDGGITAVIGLEAYKNNENYELQFLMMTEDSQSKSFMWYLTITGTNIYVADLKNGSCWKKNNKQRRKDEIFNKRMAKH